MNLEISIQRLERRARAVRKASFWGLGIMIAGMVLPISLQVLGLDDKFQWVLLVLCGCGGVAMFTTGVLAGIYSYKYLPALGRAKDDLLSTTIAQLQQQIAELGRKIDRP